MIEPTCAHPPTIILIDPQGSGNIGACARAMMNFGLTQLRLVRPKTNWLNLETRKMASGANEILEAIQIYPSTQEACADLQVIYATGSKSRDMVKPVYTPRHAAQEIYKFTQEDAAVGILFGTEPSGLGNQDVMRARALIQIPTSTLFDSLNLAQAVLLIGYEFFQTHLPSTFSPTHLSGRGNTYATQDELYGFLDQLEGELDTANFWRVPAKKPDMLINVRNIFNRLQLTKQEVSTLRGIVKALVYYRWKP